MSAIRGVGEGSSLDDNKKKKPQNHRQDWGLGRGVGGAEDDEGEKLQGM